MKVLVTGAKGFIGKNLVARLKYEEDVEVTEFDVNDSAEDLQNKINEFDFIFHLAGINRPKETKEFYEGNTDLTANILSLLEKNNLNTPIIFTSSVQATKDNDYGKSKKQAEEVLLKYKNSIIFRLHNVFGKWCRPNYNSVIATFCYNIANNLDITINDENTELELIYIDDIIEEFISVMKGNDPKEKKDNICYINPRYKKTLGEIARLIRSFKNDMESINIPETGDDFIKKLFATFVSYIDISKMSAYGKMNVDERGSFTELAHTKSCGQFSVSTSKPGVVRGNHYHHTKMERFIVVKGKAKISFRQIFSDEVYTYDVDDANIQIVTIPPGYTHKIENVGDSEMVLFLWCNEIFDKEKPDTYYMEV